MRKWNASLALRRRDANAARRRPEAAPRAAQGCRAGRVRRGQGDIEKWRRATELLIDSALDEIESLRAFGLAQAEVQAVGRELAAANGLLPASSSAQTIVKALKVPTTVYDMANAITSVARGRDDVAARLTLEEQGHRYLNRRTA